MSNKLNNLHQEWLGLHASYEQSERMSLIIKLFNIAVFLSLVILEQSLWLSLLIIGVIWMLDGIWNTFQSRTEARLMQIEAMSRESNNESLAFQFYSEWSQNRPSSADLVQEYLSSAMRPTVAFPHAPLLLLAVIFI